MSGWSLKEIKDKNATVIGVVQKVHPGIFKKQKLHKVIFSQ
jgi:hypothetical protein